jgi:transposase
LRRRLCPRLPPWHLPWILHLFLSLPLSLHPNLTPFLTSTGTTSSSTIRLRRIPADISELLDWLSRSDLYVQDEVDVRLHPTLHRVWSRKGSRGQRLVRAPGQSRRFVGFGAIDWRDGFLSIGYGLHRSADVFCLQLDHLVERSSARGRNVLVLADNLGIHTPEGSKLLRETLKKHEGKLRLVYTPPYDPEANPTERFWPAFRLAVTHNHHRDDLVSLYQDAVEYFDRLDAEPNLVLHHIGSPLANTEPTDRSSMTPSFVGRS